MKDINGVEIVPGMRVVRLIKSRNNAKDIEGKVIKSKYKELGLAIKVDKVYGYDGTERNVDPYKHGIKQSNNYLVISE